MQHLAGLPAWLLYLLVFLAAAVENVFPPFPGDTTVLIGAFLAGRGLLEPWPVFLWAGAGNLLTNLLLYRLGRWGGREFMGRHPRLFHPELLPRIEEFYGRWGLGAVFFSRFLAGFRSLVPLLAGVTRLGFGRFLLAVIGAIALQGSLVVYLGYTLGSNWDYVKSLMGGINLVLGLVAIAVAVLLALWYHRFRKSLETGERFRRRGSGRPSKQKGDQRGR